MRKSSIERFGQSNNPVSTVFGNLPLKVAIGFNILHKRVYNVFVKTFSYISENTVAPFSDNMLHHQKPEKLNFYKNHNLYSFD